MNVSVVIPNFNGKELLTTNLPKVIRVLQDYAQKNKSKIELIINDDGSTDESKEILREYETKKDQYVTYVILYNERNFGFSTTVNRAVSYATESIVVLLNSDVLPDHGFLEPLLKHFSDENVFAVGCVDKSIEASGTVLRGRGIGSWKRGFLVHRKGELSKENTLWVSGGSGAFRKTFWDDLNGLNEMMNPFYWEDIDLSYRGQKAGYKLIIEKESKVTHMHEEGAIKKSVSVNKVTTTAYRNQFYFVWTNITDIGYLISHVAWLPYHLVHAAEKRDSTFFKGFFQAAIHLPDVLKRRSKVKQQFVLTDSQVINQFKS